ncbi:MAG: HipA domain-containing protein, partial [Bifidobacteriaceae bacterium]|nr:HipA domain-containing protein [Bifidobacteriaceae bacterium]
MSQLVVELYGTRLGVLSGTWRSFDFEPAPEAMDRFGIDSPILSVAIPLSPYPARGERGKRQNFFAELLPEGPMAARLALMAGVPGADTIGLLRAYGRDVAGALEIWDPDAPGEPKHPSLEPLTDDGVAAVLGAVGTHPLGNLPNSGKTSLGGFQDKIVLTAHDGVWNRPLDGYPSTHILKPITPDYPTMIFDEEYGDRLARAIGLLPYETRIEEFAGVPALMIERYDRDPAAPRGRIHQEDFNQALGLSRNAKYQKQGGQVSVTRIARTVAAATDDDSLTRLARMVVLAVAVGNLDLHA